MKEKPFQGEWGTTILSAALEYDLVLLVLLFWSKTGNIRKIDYRKSNIYRHKYVHIWFI